MLLSATRQLVKLGIRLAKFTKKEIKNEVKLLAKAGIVQKGDVKALLKICAKEANAEQKRIRKFAVMEAVNELRKASALKKMLTERGKKALKAHGIEITIKKARRRRHS